MTSKKAKVVIDSGYLWYLREIIPVDVELADGTLVTVTKIGIAKLCVRQKY